MIRWLREFIAWSITPPFTRSFPRIGVPEDDESVAPRDLAPEERDVLLAVLNYAPFPGRDALLTQAATAQVIGLCSCGCATVDLRVDEALPAAPDSPSPIPNEGSVLDAVGRPIGGVLVFVHDGYLSLLEIYGYDPAPITAFPPLERLIVEFNPGRD